MSPFFPSTSFRKGCHEAFSPWSREQTALCQEIPRSVAPHQGREYVAGHARWHSLLIFMPCFHPWQAYQLKDGSICSSEKPGVVRAFFLPCSQCVGCRLERSRQWAVRCMHESQLSNVNCFVTLTYNDEHLPSDGSLRYEHFQLFMKRLRARLRVRIRFYMCGEYGELENRPHYHAILFGVDMLDKIHWKTLPSGYKLYRSKLLEDLWTFGFTSVGSVSFQSAAYVARYCMKKVTGSLALDHYTDKSTGVIRVPEFNHMSLKPGLGDNWLSRFPSDVDAQGRIVVNGVRANAPRFYLERIRKVDPLRYDDIKAQREFDSEARMSDNTWDRLSVKEAVQFAAISQLTRKI